MGCSCTVPKKNVDNEMESKNRIQESQPEGKSFYSDPDFVAFMKAIEDGECNTVETLFKAEYLDKTDDKGWLPLDRASSCGHLQIVQYLTVRGANVNHTNVNGWTPLHYAAISGRADILEFLIKKGASLEAQTTYWNHRRAAHWAAMMGHEKALVVLVSFGCDVNAEDGDGQTPLMCAKMYGQEKCVNVLAGAKAKPSDGKSICPANVKVMRGGMTSFEMPADPFLTMPAQTGDRKPFSSIRRNDEDNENPNDQPSESRHPAVGQKYEPPVNITPYPTIAVEIQDDFNISLLNSPTDDKTFLDSDENDKFDSSKK